MKMWRADRARWIWLIGETTPANRYVRFRKTLHLEKVPETVYVHASADCKYLLFINGKVAGRGPITTHNQYKQVDRYEVSRFLKKGENILAALVLQRHNHSSRLYPTRGGFLLELDLDGIKLGTDTTWKARWAEEYRADTPTMTHQYGNQEWVDGRKVPVGWETVGFDDSRWPDAILVEDPERYWPERLELRTAPHMERRIRHPAGLVSFFGIASQRPVREEPEPARAIMCAYTTTEAVACDAGNLVNPERGPAVFRLRPGGFSDGVGFVVDLGEEMLGYPFIDIECGAGALVHIGHGEILSRNHVQTVLRPESGAEQRYADRYTTRAGRQRFEIYDTKGCRYLEIHVTRLNACGGAREVTIHEVGLAESRPPFPHVSEFTSGDRRLNAIWDICRRTALVKCQDWHICDAQREQNQWPEFFQDMVYYQCFGRVEMIRRMIHTFCRLQLPDGYFLSYFPLIPEKTLDEIRMDDMYFYSNVAIPLLIYLDWLYAGTDGRHLFWLRCCNRLFERLQTLIGPHGTMLNVPGDPWMEWSGADIRPRSGVEQSAEITVWSAWFVFTLERAAEVATHYDKTDWAGAWRAMAATLRAAATPRFWSHERGAFVDGVYDGRPSPSVSQSTNAMAVLAGFGEPARLRQALETTENPKRCDVPSAINMMAMYHEALQHLESDADVPARIRRKWGYMLDRGATTCWEGETALEDNNGLCFGFGAHPINYMTRTLLGVTPLACGYERFSIRLAPHGLKHARGKIATPRGLIHVNWTWTDGMLSMKLTVPRGSEAVVAPPRLPGKKRSMTHVEVDGKRVALSPHEVATCTFLRRKMDACLVAAGKHTITFKG